MLRNEGIQIQVGKNPDDKCAVVKRAHWMIQDRLYKYFTYKYTYRYINILWKFVKAYNDSGHSTIGMASARVTDNDVLVIWRRTDAKIQRFRFATAKFHFGRHARISKEKIKFAKSAEHNVSTKIFMIVKVIDRRPRAVYEQEYLNGTWIDV